MRLLLKRVKVVCAIIVATGLIFVTFAPSAVFAQTLPFGFYLNFLRGNTSTRYQKRNTKNPQNKWMVKVTKNSEGKHTIARFWLENEWDVNVSKGYNTYSDSKVHAHPAYKSANNTTVKMTAENNNINMSQPYVQGSWAEEGYK